MNLNNAEIKELKDKKFRKANGWFMVEGEKFCKDLLTAGVEIVYTITSNKSLKGFNNVVVVSPKVLASLATTKTCQDVVCICKAKQVDFKSVGNSLILENLQDPGNVGTLIRSAKAFGFDDVYLIDGADPWSEKVIRSSAGTILKTRVHCCDLQQIKQNKKLVADEFLVADMDGENINNLKPTNKKVAVIIGNEGNGVSDEITSIANKKVAIPMNSEVESLNAGVAGSIIMQKIGEIKNVRT